MPITKEHTMHTMSARLRYVVVAIVATVIAAGAVVASGATAHSGTLKVKGTFESQSFSCAAPAGQCFEGTFRGPLHGPVDGSLTSITPTQQPGVVLIDVSSTIHTPSGDLTTAHQQIVSNTSPSGHGEFSVLAEITSGTGRYAGATGYLQGIGTMSPSGAATGTYAGEIRLG